MPFEEIWQNIQCQGALYGRFYADFTVKKPIPLQEWAVRSLQYIMQQCKLIRCGRDAVTVMVGKLLLDDAEFFAAEEIL